MREFESRVFATAFTDSVHGLKRQEADADVVDYCKKVKSCSGTVLSLVLSN